MDLWPSSLLIALVLVGDCFIYMLALWLVVEMIFHGVRTQCGLRSQPVDDQLGDATIPWSVEEGAAAVASNRGESRRTFALSSRSLRNRGASMASVVRDHLSSTSLVRRRGESMASASGARPPAPVDVEMLRRSPPTLSPSPQLTASPPNSAFPTPTASPRNAETTPATDVPTVAAATNSTRRDPDYYRVTSTVNVYWTCCVLITAVIRGLETRDRKPLTQWTWWSVDGPSQQPPCHLPTESDRIRLILQSTQTLFATIFVVQMSWLTSKLSAASPGSARHFMTFWAWLVIASVTFSMMVAALVATSTETFPDPFIALRNECLRMHTQAFVMGGLLLQLVMACLSFVVANCVDVGEHAIAVWHHIRFRLAVRLFPLILVEALRVAFAFERTFLVDVALDAWNRTNHGTLETSRVTCMMTQYGTILEPLVFFITYVLAELGPSRLCDQLQWYE